MDKKGCPCCGVLRSGSSAPDDVCTVILERQERLSTAQKCWEKSKNRVGVGKMVILVTMPDFAL